MAKTTITIGIPAYNERRNIGKLLDDIALQKLNSDVVLEQVLVVSDCSTDGTDEIVKEKALHNKAITLHRNLERGGKMAAMKTIFQELKSDVLVFFDADVQLVNSNTVQELLEPFLRGEENIGLVGGNPIPIKEKLTYASLASYFSYHLLQNIKKAQPNSLYSSHGRIVALQKELVKSLIDRLIVTPGDDQFLYLACTKSGRRFIYAKDAKVYYHLPVKAKDYLNQNLRFRVAVEKKAKHFGRSEVVPDFKIKHKSLILLETLLQYPLCGFCWATLYVTGMFMYHFTSAKKKYDTPLYKVADTTK